MDWVVEIVAVVGIFLGFFRDLDYIDDLHRNCDRDHDLSKIFLIVVVGIIVLEIVGLGWWSSGRLIE